MRDGDGKWSVQLGEFETSEPELNRLIAAADETIGAPPANEIGFRSARSLWGQELACVLKSGIVRGKLTPPERARIMAPLTGDFWSHVDEGQNRRYS
jgi:hypothetical protein